MSEEACHRLCTALDLFQQAVALEQVLYELNESISWRKLNLHAFNVR